MVLTLTKGGIVMKNISYALLIVLNLCFANICSAAVKVFACEPEWGALTRELGGDKVDVYVATTAQQDPHHIEAKPSLIAAVRNSSLIACTGAELEIGWLPILLRQAGRASIQSGQVGNFSAADFVKRLEVPSRLDRADGDVHPGGNPHVHTDPHNIFQVAQALAQRLMQVDAQNAAFYQTRLSDFSTRWQAAMAGWEKRAAPLRGMSVVVHHKAFPYLEQWLALQQVATLEPKPGVEPSSAHLSEVLAQLRTRPAKVVLRAPYNDPRGSEWLAEHAKIPAVELPYTVGGSARASNLFAVFDETLDKLLEANK